MNSLYRIMGLVGCLQTLLVSQNGLQADARIKLATVCEVLCSPLKFNGQLISIRGALGGTDEGSWLEGECEQPLITDGFRWPSMIALTRPTDESRLHDVDFSLDRTSYAQVHAAIRKLKIDWQHQTVVLTYTGLLETRDGLGFPTITDALGRHRKLGFSYENAAPAQLLIKSVRGPIVVVPRKLER